MAKCKQCGGTTFESITLAEYHDDLMGIAVVVHDAVTEESCANCGAIRGTLIPNLQGLVAASAVKRISMPQKLSGPEIKFLRKALGWKAKELAANLDVSPEHVSRWENGALPISPNPERYLRLVVGSLLAKDAPLIEFDAEHLVNMTIRSARAANDPIVLHFWLHRSEDDEGDGEHDWWEPEIAA